MELIINRFLRELVNIMKNIKLTRTNILLKDASFRYVEQAFNQRNTKSRQTIRYKDKRLIKIIHHFKSPQQSNIPQLTTKQMTSLTEQFLQNVMTSMDPTQAEIDEAVRVISLKYPNRDPFTFAQALFIKLQEMREQAELQQHKSSFPQEILAKSFDFHNFIKKMIAQAYYHMGYGYERFLHFMLKRHASFHIDGELYTIFSKGMVLQMYRALERMLIRSGRIIKLKHKNEVMKLNEWILSEGPPPLEEHHLLLKKHIARRYDINDSTFCIEEANLLYDILQHKYDPFVTKDVEQMKKCLNEIDLCSNSEQELNFDSLINQQEQFMQPEEFNISFPNDSTNLCNLPKDHPNPHNDFLHYDSYNHDQLNFDVESTDNLHL